MSETPPHKIDNKKIAKNTLYLYLRMGLTVIVGLYTVRVIWQVLGVDNYGIYNVVAGIVLMFQFLNEAMITSSNRFLSYELGQNNIERVRKVFRSSVRIHFIIGLTIVILAETIGLWFVNYKLNLPTDRITAANWVYQISLMSFFINVISVPYNAAIVAHEHMKIYGYVGILSVILKLIIVYLLLIIPFDKLITYAFLLLLVNIIQRIFYTYYCKKHFDECRSKANTQENESKGIMKQMFSFAGWSFVGYMGTSVRDQGLNIILNLFFSVTMNAAKGIANQVSTVLNGFSGNFIMAIIPQIIKSYAVGNVSGMIQLVTRSCRISLILISVLVIPIVICCREMLTLWLGAIEDASIWFVRIALGVLIIDSISHPVTVAQEATGKIHVVTITTSIIALLCIPAAWLWLKFDLNPYAVAWVTLSASVLILFSRIIILQREIGFKLSSFLYSVFSRSIPALIIAFSIEFFLYRIEFFKTGIIPLILYLIIGSMIYLTLAFVSLTAQERRSLIHSIRAKLHK